MLYESPRRIVALLGAFGKHMPDREIMLARELTKVHQQLLRGRAEDLLAQVEAENLERGEYTVVLGPGQERFTPAERDVLTLAQQFLGEGMSVRDAADKISRNGVPRREIYQLLIKKGHLSVL